MVTVPGLRHLNQDDRPATPNPQSASPLSDLHGVDPVSRSSNRLGFYPLVR